MLPKARTHVASTSSAALALTVGGRGRRFPVPAPAPLPLPAARPLHSSARVRARVKVQRTSPAPPLLNSLRDLRGPEFLTVLPTPLPVGEQGSVEHQRYFPDSNITALVAIVDACLSNFHDIPRAQSLFAELRRDRKAVHFLDVRVFNRFLHAYFTLAEDPNTSPREAEKYRMRAWELYTSMVENKEPAAPKAHTSAVMLWGLLR